MKQGSPMMDDNNIEIDRYRGTHKRVHSHLPNPPLYYLYIYIVTPKEMDTESEVK